MVVFVRIKPLEGHAWCVVFGFVLFGLGDFVVVVVFVLRLKLLSRWCADRTQVRSFPVSRQGVYGSCHFLSWSQIDYAFLVVKLSVNWRFGRTL